MANSFPEELDTKSFLCNPIPGEDEEKQFGSTEPRVVKYRSGEVCRVKTHGSHEATIAATAVPSAYPPTRSASLVMSDAIVGKLELDPGIDGDARVGTRLGTSEAHSACERAKAWERASNEINTHSIPDLVGLVQLSRHCHVVPETRLKLGRLIGVGPTLGERQRKPEQLAFTAGGKRQAYWRFWNPCA